MNGPASKIQLNQYAMRMNLKAHIISIKEDSKEFTSQTRFEQVKTGQNSDVTFGIVPGQLGADFKFYQVAGFISLTQNLIVFAM